MLNHSRCKQGYTIEVEIHDGPYNSIPNWDYVKLVEAFDNGAGALWATRVRSENWKQLPSNIKPL